jgi:esterase/lipase superfamily enzyme
VKDPGFKYAETNLLLMLILLAMVTCCSKSSTHTVELMPTPEVYADGTVDPFTNLDNDPSQLPEYDILYATCRKPDTDGTEYYSNERGFVLRLGRAETEIGPEGYSWEKSRRISLLKNRTDKYPVSVSGVDEIGIMDRTITVFTPTALVPGTHDEAARRFAEKINAKLMVSSKKDVYVYVHGYKVVFSNPILVSAELWHFLGYDGVFIAYAWPSTPSRWAYFSDIETAEIAAHNLRRLMEYLAEETDAERLHIIGYSAGTRVALKTLHQMAMLYADEEKATIQKRVRIGHVILIGSDMDRQVFGAYLVDGLLKTADSMSVYVSSQDRALGLSRWLFRRKRLGQMWQGSMNPEVINYLTSTSELNIIDVSGIEGSATGNGHAYFRKSPWVSSDILMTLMYDLEPDQRGLIRSPNNPVWLFAEDYIQRLRAALLKRP